MTMKGWTGSSCNTTQVPEILTWSNVSTSACQPVTCNTTISGFAFQTTCIDTLTIPTASYVVATSSSNLDCSAPTNITAIKTGGCTPIPGGSGSVMSSCSGNIPTITYCVDNACSQGCITESTSYCALGSYSYCSSGGSLPTTPAPQFNGWTTLATYATSNCSGNPTIVESIPSVTNEGCTSVSCNPYAGFPSVSSCQEGAYVPPTGVNVVVGQGQNSTCGGITIYFAVPPPATCTYFASLGQYALATCSGSTIINGRLCLDPNCSVGCTNITNGCDSTTFRYSYCTTTSSTSAPPTHAPTSSHSGASTMAFSFILNGFLIFITFALFHRVI